MNYTEISALALSIADRSDSGTVGNIDSFMRLVEARVNRKLKVMDMSVTISIPMTGTNEYDLPADFGGLRGIKHLENDRENPLVLTTPESLANLRDVQGLISNPNQQAELLYVIEGGQIKLHKELNSGNISITYYQRVPALTSGAPNNWLSDYNEDCYTFGLMVEISSFVKDKDAATLWDGRFKETINDIQLNDNKTRWSGAAMQIKTT